MKIKIFIVSTFLLSALFTGCSNPDKELPKGILTGNKWFVENGNPNTLYGVNIELKFMAESGNTVKVWEGGSTKSCICEGHFTLNEQNSKLQISDLNNTNCPWMSQLNGIYTYVYDSSRDGYNKYMFKNGDILLTHFFYEN